MEKLRGYFGWLKVVPLWVGLMSGSFSIVREAVVLFTDSPSPLWQRNLFWSCVWVTFVFSMIAAWLIKNQELNTEKAKHTFPIIKGSILKLIIDPGMTETEIWSDLLSFITIKVRLENDSPTPTNITDCYVVVNTNLGSYTPIKEKTKSLYFQPDPRLDTTDAIDLWDIDSRDMDKQLVRGRAETWWFRGRLPPEFSEELYKEIDERNIQSELERIKEVVLWVTDGFGRKHPIKGVPPWDSSGDIKRGAFYA